MLLVIIYLAFIGLGLPDAMLGAAWPVMHKEYVAPIEMAGVLSMIIVGGTIVSSFYSGVVLQKWGVGRVTWVSVMMTAVALLGFSLSPSVLWLALLAVPLGLGAGSVDAGLNHYVATHYKAHHMSWLHCFWGIGAILGPLLMSHFIAGGESWRKGYLTVSVIQFAIVLLLLFSLSLWKKGDMAAASTVPVRGKVTQIKGVKLSLFAFFFYIGVEATISLWGSSFLVNAKELPVATAVLWVSLFYVGVTFGRLITGFVTFCFENRTLIRVGQGLILVGAVLLIVPLPPLFLLIGLVLVGFGCAPIYPCMLHITPERFGTEHSQRIIGYQMAVANIGGAFLPPLFGWFAAKTTFSVFPYVIVAYTIAMLILSEKLRPQCGES
ncbi:MFS transporter [Ammoniphilus resinae]|nr:MFS transporter [Ammoniphilus resinae]